LFAGSTQRQAVQNNSIQKYLLEIGNSGRPYRGGTPEVASHSWRSSRGFRIENWLDDWNVAALLFRKRGFAGAILVAALALPLLNGLPALRYLRKLNKLSPVLGWAAETKQRREREPERLTGSQLTQYGHSTHFTGSWSEIGAVRSERLAQRPHFTENHVLGETAYRQEPVGRRSDRHWWIFRSQIPGYFGVVKNRATTAVSGVYST
jgi:hypothetical protein